VVDVKDEIEQHWRDLGSFIRDQRHVGQLSLRKLSEMAGISNPYLSQIERGLRKPSAEILRQIASALHISAETLYVRAGILDEPGAPADLIAEIRRSPDLNDEHKRALVQLYEMFRREYADSVGRQAAAADDDPADADLIGGPGEGDDGSPSGEVPADESESASAARG
jgi:transcriptional regulator with XRE-family HTH domain